MSAPVCPDCGRPVWPGRYDQCPTDQCVAGDGLDHEEVLCLRIARDHAVVRRREHRVSMERVEAERDEWRQRAIDADRERQALASIMESAARADVHAVVVRDLAAALAREEELRVLVERYLSPARVWSTIDHDARAFLAANPRREK